MNRGTTIYFMCPDYSVPSGGTRTIYRFVDLLNSLGHRAAVWHGSRDFRCNWFDNSTHVVTAESLCLAPYDVLVAPEWGGSRFAQCTEPAKVVMLNQNHFNTFSGNELDTSGQGSYPGWPNVVAVIATSRAIHSFLSKIVGNDIPLYRVPLLVDGELFQPGRKERTVCFMPRRRTAELTAVLQLLCRSPVLDGWRFEPIDEMSDIEVARSLSKAAIFISMSDREGFGLPPAEAMAAGCWVVGFTGNGGEEYMLPHFAEPVSDQDLVVVAEAVERAAALWDSNRSELERRAAAGRAFVLDNYSRDAVVEALVQVFLEITSPHSAALQTEHVHVHHMSTCNPENRSSLKRILSPWLPPKFLSLGRTAAESVRTARASR